MFGGTSQRPLLRFRLAGIPVEVQPWFVLMVGAGALALRGAALGVLWFAVVAASVLWHELGHALTMRALGYPPRIELVALGGLAHWPAGASPSARQALLVTAAGPGAGLALGAAVWAVARGAGPVPGLAGVAVEWLLWANVAWSLFNLVPMLPLDGARLLDHLSGVAGRARQPRWVGWASVVTGGAVALFALSRGSAWVAVLGGIGVAHGVDRVRRGRGWSTGGDVEAARGRARRASARGDLAGAVAAVVPLARVGALPERDLALLVRWLVELGRHDELVALCQDRLRAFARRSDAEPLARLGAEALADVDAHALAIAQVAFRQLNLPYHAYDAACHLVRLGRPDEAIAWLGQALDAGLDCGAPLASDPALEPLGSHPEFAALAARAGRTRARA